MKNNNGISLVALVIIIIILIILAAIAITAGTDTYDRAVESRLEEQKSNIIHAVTERFADNQRNEMVSPLIGSSIQISTENLREDEYAGVEDQIYNFLIQKFKDEGRLALDDDSKNKEMEANIEKFVKDNFKDMKYTRILLYSDLITLNIQTTDTNAIYLVNYYSSDVVGPIL